MKGPNSDYDSDESDENYEIDDHDVLDEIFEEMVENGDYTSYELYLFFEL